MAVFDQDEHGAVGVSATDPDVVEAAAVAQRDGARTVDDVVADPVVGVIECLGGRCGLGSGCVWKYPGFTDGWVVG